MSRVNSVGMRVDTDFEKLCEDVSIGRIKMGKDRKQVKPRRITKAIVRIPNIKEVLINSDFKDGF